MGGGAGGGLGGGSWSPENIEKINRTLSDELKRRGLDAPKKPERPEWQFWTGILIIFLVIAFIVYAVLAKSGQ